MDTLRRRALLLAVLCLTAWGCGGRNNPISLDMDLYLHPEGARGNDLLLQTAIQKKLNDDRQLGKWPVHVRVVDGLVLLSGKVNSEELKSRAAEMATATVVRVDEQSIQPVGAVRNSIEVTR
jgi:hypothetical protein